MSARAHGRHRPRRGRRAARIAVEALLLAASLAATGWLAQRALSEGVTTGPLPTVQASPSPTPATV